MCNNILCHNNVPAYIRDDGTAEYDPEFVHGHFRIKVVYQAGHKEKGDEMDGLEIVLLVLVSFLVGMIMNRRDKNA